ncbi:hypothetical protein GCM10009821_07720 [Aeromicrobium halocynthiae]|uniref:WD40 repeat domain-containing protein n=1 Tax=Aeromicrobium halocynthiae TaxID=560557 RepID=A0ABN2VTK9_9ACTN
MNPRRRRLLIPGLLVVLLVVVAVVSFSRGAWAVEAVPDVEPLGVVDDARITESSGLALSTDDPDLAYTVNDSGNTDAVYAVELSSGAIVGVTTISGTDWVDTEALALHDGTLWVADVGDNAGVRDEVTLYSLDEPGRGDSTVAPRRHRLQHPGGPVDVESLAVDPTSGRMLLVTKQLLEGSLLALAPDPPVEEVTTLDEVGISTLSLATDAAWTPDGRHLVVRNYGEAQVLDPDSGDVVTTFALPEQEQGETLAVAADGGSIVIGTEGRPAPLLRVALDLPEQQPGRGALENTSATEPTPGIPDEEIGRRWLTPVLSLVALGVLALVTVWMERSPRRRTKRRRR